MCFQEATGATAEKAGQMLAPLPLLSVAFVHPEQPMEVPPCNRWEFPLVRAFSCL